ncbi:putative lipoprotein [Streptococcus pseudoporcinus]|uniref:Putative lipoprotein n=1 Tax=Streptococcus pseudoporcinus TaxID=361101 RepID=A0A4U9XXN4_9STRE|nr:DUF4430 domain-containing protein [Streptococcus pseudoporcinus]VTS18299.1 putative lipoprotein [Streptococcus pseudoporcinus]
MKKWSKLILICLSGLLFVACGRQGQNISQAKKEAYVHLTVKEDTNEVDEKVAFQEGDTVMDVLKANYKVKEKDGFIRAIDGYQQKPNEKVYWFYKVNGKMATKAANVLKVKKGDNIYFYLDKVK